MVHNNRSFFRIDVMMPCSYRILSSEKANSEPLPTSADSGFIEKYFMEDISQLDKQITSVISQIEQKSSLLASALTAMNSKINFLLQTIDEKQLSKAIPEQMVNLSAGGLAIKVEGIVNPSDKIDLLIQPLADESPILVRCNIVKIVPDTDRKDASTLSLEYQNLAEDDRRKLVYFIQAKEIEFANLQRPNQ